MNDKDIVTNLKKLFGEATSPGQAFDALLDMRRAGVDWDAAYRAVTTHGRAVERLKRLDEDEDTFECPGCGVARTNRAFCIVPHCPEHKANPETERLKREEREPAFKNPVITFGKYNGKTLLEVIKLNPGYIRWMANDHSAEFWRKQAEMAMIAAETLAPPNRDTSDTGYFA